MNTSKGIVIWVVVLILLIIALAWWLVIQHPSNNLAAVSQALPGESAGVASLKIDTQFPGDIVYVTSVVAPRDGFVVINKDSGGQPGYIIGAEYFAAGTSTQTGSVSLSEPSQEGATYYATLYADTNGDKNFSASQDLPWRDSNNQLITTQFTTTKNLPETKG